METYFARSARATQLSLRQMELLVGSMLGDGTLLRTTRGYCFRVHHGLAQRDLVDWKYNILQRFVRTAPRGCGAAGYYFRTVSHDTFADLRALFYDGRRKIVPIDFVEEYLSPFAMAVWIMDDGARDGRQLRLNTQSFTVSEVRDLARIVELKFNAPATVNVDKGKPRLRIAQSGMAKLINAVRPHMHQTMLYKLSR